LDEKHNIFWHNFQPFHHDMSILRGCHYRIKQNEIMEYLLRLYVWLVRYWRWVNYGAESTNRTSLTQLLNCHT